MASYGRKVTGAAQDVLWYLIFVSAHNHAKLFLSILSRFVNSWKITRKSIEAFGKTGSEHNLNYNSLISAV